MLVRRAAGVVGDEGRRCEADAEAALALVSQIEELALRDRVKRKDMAERGPRGGQAHWKEQWKKAALDKGGRDGWAFDRWVERKPGSGRGSTAWEGRAVFRQ